MNPARKSIIYSLAARAAVGSGFSGRVVCEPLGRDKMGRKVFEKKRDNPHSDRFIEVGTKALRRETDVWGDAAGTAPAVTSVTSLSPSI